MQPSESKFFDVLDNEKIFKRRERESVLYGMEKYQNEGIGLSLLSLAVSEYYVVKTYQSKGYVKVIEFGSGFSTQFLVDIREKYNFENFEITSFDDSEEYAYRGAGKHQFLRLNVRNLLTCNDENYEAMF